VLVTKDEDRRLARHSADRAVQKLIRNRVAKYHDPLLPEPFDNTD
jgi:hypothetical protein